MYSYNRENAPRRRVGRVGRVSADMYEKRQYFADIEQSGGRGDHFYGHGAAFPGHGYGYYYNNHANSYSHNNPKHNSSHAHYSSSSNNNKNTHYANNNQPRGGPGASSQTHKNHHIQSGSRKKNPNFHWKKTPKNVSSSSSSPSKAEKKDQTSTNVIKGKFDHEKIEGKKQPTQDAPAAHSTQIHVDSINLRHGVYFHEDHRPKRKVSSQTQSAHADNIERKILYEQRGKSRLVPYGYPPYVRGRGYRLNRPPRFQASAMGYNEAYMHDPRMMQVYSETDPYFYGHPRTQAYPMTYPEGSYYQRPMGQMVSGGPPPLTHALAHRQQHPGPAMGQYYGAPSHNDYYVQQAQYEEELRARQAYEEELERQRRRKKESSHERTHKRAAPPATDYDDEKVVSQKKRKDEMSPGTKVNRIQKQLEYYLSDHNLQKDEYVRQLFNEEGWINAEEFCKFKRMRNFEATPELIVEAAYHSHFIDVNGMKIRIKSDWKKYIEMTKIMFAELGEKFKDHGLVSKDDISDIVKKIEEKAEKYKKKMEERRKRKEQDKNKEEKKEVAPADSNEKPVEKVKKNDVKGEEVKKQATETKETPAKDVSKDAQEKEKEEVVDID